MNELLQWAAMGGYSLYVWPAYGIVCVVLVMNLLELKLSRIKTQRKLTQWFKRQLS